MRVHGAAGVAQHHEAGLFDGPGPPCQREELAARCDGPPEAAPQVGPSAPAHRYPPAAGASGEAQAPVGGGAFPWPAKSAGEHPSNVRAAALPPGCSRAPRLPESWRAARRTVPRPPPGAGLIRGGPGDVRRAARTRLRRLQAARRSQDREQLLEHREARGRILSAVLKASRTSSRSHGPRESGRQPSASSLRVEADAPLAQGAREAARDGGRDPHAPRSRASARADSSRRRPARAGRGGL